MSQELTGKILADKYSVEEVLREDNFGTIYRGTHLLMEKPVIIKVLSTTLAVDDNIVKQFSEEARVNSHISHPNILNVTDFGTDAEDNLVYIVMEAVDGETLRSALVQSGKFRTDRAVRVARQTAAALSAAHSNNIIHGQISPDSILLNHLLNGVESVKVTDFGAIAFNDDEYSIEQAKYLSPEQYADAAQTDERSDIYTLGIIFYEMLTGEVPFQAESVTDLMLKKSEELPAPLSAFRNDVPADVEPVILKALSKNPAARQQSAAEFVVELDKAVRFDTEQETIIVPNAAAATANNNVWKTAFVVLAAISLLSVAIIYATQVKQTNPETQLQTDANGMPVQPLGAATGMSEQGVNNMLPYQLPEYGSDANSQYPDQVQQMPGGDGYDPWGRGGSPPPGAPPPIYSGNQIYIPGDSGSIFMPNGEGGIILVPKETNVNANVAPSPTKSPKDNNANAKPSPPPNATTDEVPAASPKPTTKPKASPPAEKPKDAPPATTDKRPVSGQQQDSEQ